ncbi:MAG: CHAT domain-containing protein [Dehalococcoidia bacterium]|nr:CHAT domain-containing protein [Dehalococcoidia bacterium]
MAKRSGIPNILALFSHPFVDQEGKPLLALNTQREQQTLLKTLQESGRALHVRFDIATTDNLSRGLAAGANVLHFSGHGAPEGVAFEDGRGGPHLLSSAQLKRIISHFDLQFGFVSACHSRPTGEALVAAGIPHVVAVETPEVVDDDAATLFARDFYRHLFAGRTIQDAFDIARDVMRADPVRRVARDATKFCLLPKADTHRVALFAALPSGHLQDLTPHQTPTNLPSRQEDFTGRSRELHKAIGLVLDHPLVTLTGAPGIGKTRVCVEAARWCHERGLFPDGVFMVQLEAASSSGVLRAQITAVLGLQAENDPELAMALGSFKALFLLDNAEDLLRSGRAGFVGFLDLLLQGCPDIKFLVTSREPLGGGLHATEQVTGVERLPFPDDIDLFRRAAPRSLTANEDQSPSLEGILVFLGGHPLSIRIVAGQLLHHTIDEVWLRLQKRRNEAIEIPGLSPEDRKRTQSLAVSVDSSYDFHLEHHPDASRLFTLLSLFPAGVQADALQEILKGFPWEDALASLVRGSLVDKSGDRYALLPPIRLYAAAKLTPRDRRHYGPRAVSYFAAFSQALYGALGSDQAAAARIVFAREEPNFRSCLTLPGRRTRTGTTISPHGTLASLLVNLYSHTDRLADGMLAAGDGLQATFRLHDRLGEANTLKARGDLKQRQADLKGAGEDYTAALDIYRGIGARLGEANTLKARGILALASGQAQPAHENLTSALKLYAAMDDRYSSINTLMPLAVILDALGLRDDALKALDAAEQLCQDINDDGLLAQCRNLRDQLKG